MARTLGHNWLSDTFQLSFEIPNLARRVLGEGSLSAFIVPVFTRKRTQEGEAAGWRFASNALVTMAVYTGILTVVCWLLAPAIFSLFGGYALSHRVEGETADAVAALEPGAVVIVAEQVITEGTRLVRIMVPTVMLLCIAAMIMGLLHTVGRFFTPALGGVVLNVCMIAVCLWCWGWDKEAIVTPLAWATVIAVGIRILVMIPHLLAAGWRPRLIFQPRSDAMRSLYGLMIPATAGMGIQHINILVNRTLGALLGSGTVTALTFSNRLALFPQALIANALQVAMLPTLTKRLEEGNLDALRATLNMVVRLALLLFLPATVGLMVLARPITATLFEGGLFDAEGTRETAWALMFYALGLTPAALLQIITPLYYAQHDTRTPLRAGAISVVCNLLLNLSLMWTPLGLGGLALSASIASAINLWLLVRWLKIDLHGVVDRPLLRLLAEASLLSAAMGAVSGGGWLWMAPHFEMASWSLRAGMTVGLIVAGGAVYALGAKLLRVREMDEALRVILRRR
jgi:putative peptidoglycan lipid II flippase